MKNYHYAVIEKPTSLPSAPEVTDPDMESVDYKRQPDVPALREAVTAAGGLTCGIFRGGMFGLKTNQVAALSAWSGVGNGRACLDEFASGTDLELRAQEDLVATVRPSEPSAIEAPGVYVIRWLSMRADDIAEYTRLCLETWPRFEAGGTQKCYGVFRPIEPNGSCTLLMLTWYRDLTAWERSRQLDPRDKHLWIRRSQMELSHWAEVGRLAE